MTIKSTWGVCYQTRYSIECICGKDFQIKGERETYSAKKVAIPKFQNLADESLNVKVHIAYLLHKGLLAR